MLFSTRALHRYGSGAVFGYALLQHEESLHVLWQSWGVSVMTIVLMYEHIECLRNYSVTYLDILSRYAELRRKQENISLTH